MFIVKVKFVCFIFLYENDYCARKLAFRLEKKIVEKEEGNK